jgi:hypothetical protein
MRHKGKWNSRSDGRSRVSQNCQRCQKGRKKGQYYHRRQEKGDIITVPPPRVSVLTDLSMSSTSSDRLCISGRRVSVLRGVCVCGKSPPQD